MRRINSKTAARATAGAHEAFTVLNAACVKTFNAIRYLLFIKIQFNLNVVKCIR